MKKKYRVYEKDGAIFRGPDMDGLGVDHVQVPGGGWEFYRGSRADPVLYGDYKGVREFDVPHKNAKPSKAA